MKGFISLTLTGVLLCVTCSSTDSNSSSRVSPLVLPWITPMDHGSQASPSKMAKKTRGSALLDALHTPQSSRRFQLMQDIGTPKRLNMTWISLYNFSWPTLYIQTYKLAAFADFHIIEESANCPWHRFALSKCPSSSFIRSSCKKASLCPSQERCAQGKEGWDHTQTDLFGSGAVQHIQSIYWKWQNPKETHKESMWYCTQGCGWSTQEAVFQQNTLGGVMNENGPDY